MSKKEQNPKSVLNNRNLPEDFRYYVHSRTKVLFAEWVPYHWRSLSALILIVPRQPHGYDDTTSPEVAVTADIDYWLESTQLYRSKKYSKSSLMRISSSNNWTSFEDKIYWLLDPRT